MRPDREVDHCYILSIELTAAYFQIPKRRRWYSSALVILTPLIPGWSEGLVLYYGVYPYWCQFYL